MLKEINISGDFPENQQINGASEQDHERPDEKISFLERGRGPFRESDPDDADSSQRAPKSESAGAAAAKARSLSSQELTLSYLCENPKMGLGEKEIPGNHLLISLEKGRYKGKEVISDCMAGDDRWVERDFFHLNETLGFKRAVSAPGEGAATEKTEKKAKLDLSLGLPDVSLCLASSNLGSKGENADLGSAPCNPLSNPLKSSTRSVVQSIAPSHSDDFAGASLSYTHSHPFSHNPSCSLTRNSTENYEYSVGSRRRDSDQIWNCGEGTNGSVHSRFKPLGDGGIALANGGNPISAARAGGNKDGYSNHYRANSSDNLSFFPSELPAMQRKDSQSVDSRGRTSDQWKPVDNGMVNSDGEKGFGLGRPEEALREIALGPVSITAKVIRELPHDVVEAIREYLKILVGSPEKEDFMSLQRQLERRSDLTSETLSCAHRLQLEILVTLKTGIANYISGSFRIPSSELVEIFLLQRCRNINCKNLLPVDDCDCKICLTKGFCSACMCPVCMNFDCALNTCSWVGCDVCSHWCHAVCGMNKNLIRLGSSSKAVGAAEEMYFHCIGCGHESEMFGFVKDVFETCAKTWDPETLMKELDCVRMIFQGSVDYKGKELHSRADDTLGQLRMRLLSPSDACKSFLQSFERGFQNFSVCSTSNDVMKALKSADAFLPPPSLPKPAVETNNSTTRADIFQRKSQQGNLSKNETTAEPELNFVGALKDDFESLEGIVKMKEAEARFYQVRADAARTEAEGYQKLVRLKSEKLEEEYTSKLAKLCLQETKDRRRKKLEELENVKNSHLDYYKMKMRMEAQISGLLERMEAIKKQWV